MTREEPMGLVMAGAVRQSFLARLPGFLAHLGPVSGSSYLAARRAVKTLRAGFAVPGCSALEMCRAIWIAGAEASLDRMVHDLAAQTPMHRTIIVLCGTTRDSLWPASLRDAGARIATLNAIDESDERAFVAEGHPDAVRMLRKLLAEDGRKLIQIAASTKGLYFAGIRMARELLLPPAVASVECLRAAGFERADAIEVVTALGARALNAYAKSGDKDWNESAGAALFADAVRKAQEEFEGRRETSVRHIDSGQPERHPARSEITSTPTSTSRSTSRPARAARAGPGRGP